MSVYQLGGLLVNGWIYAIEGAIFYALPKYALQLMGLQSPGQFTIDALRLIGASRIGLGGTFVYASLGDEDEQRHAGRNAMIVSFLSAFALIYSYLNPEPGQSINKMAVYATVGLNSFFGLFHTFFAFNLGRFLPERDDD